MSWYFPLAVVWPYKREELAAMSIKQVDIPNNTAHLDVKKLRNNSYYEGLMCQHPAVVANDYLYSIIGRLGSITTNVVVLRIRLLRRYIIFNIIILIILKINLNLNIIMLLS